MTQQVPDRDPSNDTSRRKFLAAIGTIAGGAGVLTGLRKADAFTTTGVDRYSQTRIGDDADAIVPITGKGTTSTPTFGNNFETDLTLTLSAPNEPSAEFDVNVTGTAESTVTFTVSPGDTTPVEMTADTNEITVTIDGTHSHGTTSFSRVFTPSTAGQIDVTGSVDTAGGSGKFYFGLQNNGSTDAVITGIRVDSTSTNAETVSNGDVFSIDESDDPTVTPRQLVSADLDIDDVTTASVPITGFDGGDTVTLQDTGVETIFELDRFQNPPGPGNPNTNMQNETVTITLTFDDASTGSYHIS